jgi:hypothetical protein
MGLEPSQCSLSHQRNDHGQGSLRSLSRSHHRLSAEIHPRRYSGQQALSDVTSDTGSKNSEFDRRLPDADVVISQPFWPAYLTAERIAKAKKLKLALMAGIGSDHVDLKAAAAHGVTVAEETFSTPTTSAWPNTQRDDAAHLGFLALRSGSLRCGHTGDIAGLLRRAPAAARISDC